VGTGSAFTAKLLQRRARRHKRFPQSSEQPMCHLIFGVDKAKTAAIAQNHISWKKNRGMKSIKIGFDPVLPWRF
jgi:hypothetical protein